MTFGQLAIYFKNSPIKIFEEANFTIDGQPELKSVESTQSEDLEIENSTSLSEGKEEDQEEIENEVDEQEEKITYDEEEQTAQENEIKEPEKNEDVPNVSKNQVVKRPLQPSKKYRVCQYCGKVVSNIDVHIKRCHGDFKCIECKQSFKTKEELDSHEELHGDNEFPCDTCTLSFKRAFDYAVHSREHAGLKHFKCPMCAFETSSRSSVHIHIKHHEKDYKYHCELCDRGFLSVAVYKEHVEAHSGVKRYKCDICNKTFLYNRYLKVHRKLNHKKILEGVEEINECHVCNRRFSFSKSLIRHLSKIHGIGKDNSVDCPVCLKKISNPYNLKMHMRTHTGEKPYVCEICGKPFSKKVYLRRHLAIHP